MTTTIHLNAGVSKSLIDWITEVLGDDGSIHTNFADYASITFPTSYPKEDLNNFIESLKTRYPIRIDQDNI